MSIFEIRSSDAKCYTILCDEVTDVSSKEQLSIVLHFVDTNCNIREDFVDFVSVERITGEIIASKLKETLARYNLDLQDCRFHFHGNVFFP